MPGELRFVLQPTKMRKSRPVRQQLRVKRLVLADLRGGRVQVTCLITTAIDPPEGEAPIEGSLSVHEPRPMGHLPCSG